MAQFCLVPAVAEKFKQAILNGEVDPQKLAEMTSSKERRDFLAKYVGENNAEPVNALFESKLLLKSQQTGMINWAKRVMGTNKVTLQDMISKIQRLDKVLNPKDREAFLEDFAAQKIGTHITYEEAQKITELSKRVQETKGVGDRMDYGRAAVDLGNYVSELKNPSKSFGEMVKDIPGTTKAIQASLDNSAIFRQGWKTFLTNPVIWGKNALSSFKNLVQTFGGKEVMNEVKADILSRPNAELYQKAKLATATAEEDFPTSLPEKIPVFGRFYKASEVAYNAFLHKMRADVFDKYIDIAKKNDIELNDKQLKSIGKMVNSLTGRGSLGVAEPLAGFANNVFFSTRKLKADFDFLTAHTFEGIRTGDRPTAFVRKQAALNLVKATVATAAIMTIANNLKPDSAEQDSTSADFGKIKVGNTRFDISGGMGSMVTLASRLIQQSSKSSTTGKVSPIDSGKFGSATTLSVLEDYFANKLSPIARVVYEMRVKHQTFSGQPATLKNEIPQLFEPLPFKTAQELYSSPGAADMLLGMIADGLGISVNTYSPTKKK